MKFRARDMIQIVKYGRKIEKNYKIVLAALEKK